MRATSKHLQIQSRSAKHIFILQMHRNIVSLFKRFGRRVFQIRTSSSCKPLALSFPVLRTITYMKDIFWIIVICILLFLSIKELRNYKKLENTNGYNILQNSRHYRLLAIVIVTVIGIIIFICRKLFIE